LDGRRILGSEVVPKMNVTRSQPSILSLTAKDICTTIVTHIRALSIIESITPRQLHNGTPLPISPIDPKRDPQANSSLQSALFSFPSLLLVLLLLICTSTYLHSVLPSILDRNKEGLLGIFWKFARIGERLSPYVGVCCVIMAVSLLWSLLWLPAVEFGMLTMPVMGQVSIAWGT